MLKNLRYLLTSFSLVITHFVVLGLFLAGVIPNVSSRDPFIYSLLLTVVGGIALYISYFSFYVFRKTKGVQMLVISSGFFVLGASYLLFTLSGPDFNFLGIFKAVFSLAENYGVFFGSAMMLFLLVPLDNFKERIYSHRLEVFLSIVVIYSFTLFIVILKPEYVATLQGASSVFLGSACIFLLLIFIFLFHQYREVGSRFLINLFTGVILFTTSIIISFFDDRNNLFWWYGQATVLVSFLIILVGFILAQWE
ncbi:MAG: hypothetical protein NT091_00235 [Candidatus Falkowbacteria bacterium]|nr:hypothetical protein [Candidatus Falkowbacteria bacterium]